MNNFTRFGELKHLWSLALVEMLKYLPWTSMSLHCEFFPRRNGPYLSALDSGKQRQHIRISKERKSFYPGDSVEVLTQSQEEVRISVRRRKAKFGSFSKQGDHH